MASCLNFWSKPAYPPSCPNRAIVAVNCSADAVVEGAKAGCSYVRLADYFCVTSLDLPTLAVSFFAVAMLSGIGVLGTYLTVKGVQYAINRCKNPGDMRELIDQPAG